MYFDNFSDFVSMGGHAQYVWSCYFIALLVMILNLVLPVMARHRFFIEQSRQLRRESRINEARDSSNNSSEANNASGS